jgi:hypothetical protein
MALDFPCHSENIDWPKKHRNSRRTSFRQDSQIHIVNSAAREQFTPDCRGHNRLPRCPGQLGSGRSRAPNQAGTPIKERSYQSAAGRSHGPVMSFRFGGYCPMVAFLLSAWRRLASPETSRQAAEGVVPASSASRSTALVFGSTVRNPSHCATLNETYQAMPCCLNQASIRFHPSLACCGR